MKIFYRILYSIFLIMLAVCSKAQETTVSTGGIISGSGGSVSYSIGQVAFKSQSGINGSVAAGIQQAYEIFILTAAENINDIQLSCSVFPNPATDFLYLQINSLNYKNVNYQLFDLTGTMLKSQRIETDKTSISMFEYVPATYFLKVFVDQINVKTFKIIKH